MKTLPFEVNSNSDSLLADQIFSKLMEAIRSGYFTPGDRLPSILQMAEQLKVSHMTIQQVVRRLSSAGEIVARPKQGIRIVDSGRSPWVAHMLLVLFGSESFFSAACNRAVQLSFDKANIRTSSFCMSGQEYRDGLSHIKTLLDTNDIDVGVIFGLTSGIRDEFLARGIPYVCTLPEPDENAAAALALDLAPPLRELAAHCRERGVRSAWVLYPWNVNPERCEQDILEAAGIACRCLSASPSTRVDGPEDNERAGFELVRDLLASRKQLPDLLYFADDYLARGGLTAILGAGIRVPGDLQVAAQTNRRHTPVFPETILRVELDPRGGGEALAALAQKVLSRPKAQRRPPDVFPVRFVTGKTHEERKGLKGL